MYEHTHLYEGEKEREGEPEPATIKTKGVQKQNCMILNIERQTGQLEKWQGNEYKRVPQQPGMKFPQQEKSIRKHVICGSSWNNVGSETSACVLST